MTVIDYLPVGEEVGPNVLLSQTKKCIISKVMASITVFLRLVLLDKHHSYMNTIMKHLLTSASTVFLL